jgi:peptidoglycan/LPS O-acetylase OafA/YrhL
VVSNSSSHIGYRADIDGLRAVAVLTVIAYHAFPQWARGGFIGVDVFFTISGFLISTIIFKGLADDKFSFTDFYSRRIRRIFPALIAVLAVCLAFGWFVLLPHEYKQLAKHVVGGATFISNFLLWQESGYFDNTADTKPLLHLWSLGIEEQFYILWPALLWLAYRFKVNALWIIVTIGFCSFVLNIHQVRADEIATFYSPQTRIWELLIGAGLAYLLSYSPKKIIQWASDADTLLGRKILANLCSLTGLVAICVGLALIMRGRHFPGVWPLLPAGGAALLILGGTDAWINKKILANRALVWIGLISFPLYLWHWPLLSFARIIEGEVPSNFVRSIAVLLSIVFATLTYWLIEKPLRFGTHAKLKTAGLLIGMTAIASFAYAVYVNDGFSFRGPQVAGKDAGNDGGYPVKLLEECGLKEVDRANFTCLKDSRPFVKYALIGDSKALAILSGLMRTSLDDARWLMIANGAKATPVPLISDHPAYKSYQPAIALAVKAINDNPEITDVVLVTATRNLFQLRNDTDIEDLEASPFYEAALSGLQNTIDQFKAANKRVTLVVDNPTLPHPEDCLLRVTSSELINKLLKSSLNQRCQLPIDRHLALSKKYRALLGELEKNNPQTVSIFETLPFMCDQQRGLCETMQNGKLMYIFTDHISDYAAGKIGRSLNEHLRDSKAPMSLIN